MENESLKKEIESLKMQLEEVKTMDETSATTVEKEEVKVEEEMKVAGTVIRKSTLIAGAITESASTVSSKSS